MVFAVTMNSKANALLALMIATNFVELKGQVYKRTDTNKLWTLACQVSIAFCVTFDVTFDESRVECMAWSISN
jgi:hypothetical protein